MKKQLSKRTALLYKILNGKKVPVCDYQGTCTNKAFKEVYPDLINKNKGGWNYLCKKHFKEEQKKYKGKLPYCSVQE